MHLTPRFAESARERYAVWDLGNEALYELCRKHPAHRCDDTYARFFVRCGQFHEEIERLMDRKLSPREVDTVLLAVAAQQ